MSTSPCDGFGSMEAYGLAKTADLLDDAAAAISAAAESPDPEAIHKMRVAIRRFQQALRLFRQFLRKKGLRRVRTELKEIMTAAGNVRNYDIAIGLVRKARGTTEALTVDRAAARQQFATLLQTAVRPGMDREWRSVLGLKR
ncbi:MAG TPA: CHAD domain-containing protein [Bryobacteraceae bacterium]|nr:CHAD domain-containing protein [Bryobacteraceae bacterium]